MGCGTSKACSGSNELVQSSQTHPKGQVNHADSQQDDLSAAEQGQQPDVQEADKLFSDGKFQDALALYRSSLRDMQDKSTRPPAAKRLDSVPLLSKQAACFSGLKNYAHAVPLLHGALETRSALLGASHPDTLASVKEMAASLEDMHCYEAAVPLRRRVYSAVQVVDEPDNAEALTAAAQLCNCLMKAGQADEALPLLRSTYQGRSELLGPEHQGTLEVLRTLTSCLQGLGLHAEAIPLLRQLLSCLLVSPEAGPDHRDTLGVMDNLAHSLQHTGEHGQARPMLSKSLNGRRSSLGVVHPDTVQSTKRLANLLSQEDNLEAALPLYLEVLAAARVAAAAAAPVVDAKGRTLSDAGGTSGAMAVATAASAVAGCLGGLGRWAEAEPLYREAVQVIGLCCGGTEAADPDALRVTAGLAEALEALPGRAAEALPLWELAAEGLGAVLGAQHPDTLRCQARAHAALLAQHALSVDRLPSPRQARGFVERGKSSLRLPPLDRAFSSSHPTTLSSPQASPRMTIAPLLPPLGPDRSHSSFHTTTLSAAASPRRSSAAPPQEDTRLAGLLPGLGSGAQAAPAATAASAPDLDNTGDKLSVLLQRLQAPSGSSRPGSPGGKSAISAH